jgi:hypothetical protein
MWVCLIVTVIRRVVSPISLKQHLVKQILLQIWTTDAVITVSVGGLVIDLLSEQSVLVT